MCIRDSVNTALTTISTATSILQQMQSLAQQAESTTNTTQIGNLQTQYNQLQGQLNELTQNDANYQGTNLLSGVAGNNLVINFNADGTSNITISATDTTQTTYQPAAATNWASGSTAIQASETAASSAVTAYNGLSQTLGSYSCLLYTSLLPPGTLSVQLGGAARRRFAAFVPGEPAVARRPAFRAGQPRSNRKSGRQSPV